MHQRQHSMLPVQPSRRGGCGAAGVAPTLIFGSAAGGVQNLEHSQRDRVWLLPAYPGSKPKFPNYSLFAVSTGAKPVVKKLAGAPGETDAALPLAAAGLKDRATGIRGWKKSVPYGVRALGPKLYYLAGKSGTVGAISSSSDWAPSCNSCALRLPPISIFVDVSEAAEERRLAVEVECSDSSSGNGLVLA